MIDDFARSAGTMVTVGGMVSGSPMIVTRETMEYGIQEVMKATEIKKMITFYT